MAEFALPDPEGIADAPTEAALTWARLAAFVAGHSFNAKLVPDTLHILLEEEDFFDSLDQIHAIEADIIRGLEKETIVNSTLWPYGADPLADEWAASAEMRQNHPGWSVFTDLYENALHGRPQNWLLLTELAEKDGDFWTGPDNEVLDRIAAVLEGFEYNEDQVPTLPKQLSALPVGEKTSVAHVKQVMQSARKELPDTFDALLGFIDLEIQRLQSRNYQSEGEAEEARRQIRSLRIMSQAAERLAALVPKEPEMPQEDAEEAEKLSRLYMRKFKEWPRASADDLVDTTCRAAVIGISTGVLVAFGLPLQPVLAVSAALFGGKKFIDAVKAGK